MAAQNALMAKRALKAVFTGAEYEAALQEVAAEMADGVDVPRLAHVATSELETPPAFPLLEILLGSAEPQNEEGLEHENDFDLVFAVVGDDEETVTDLVERYVLAARRVFTPLTEKGALLMPYVGNVPVVVGREDFAPVGRVKSGLSASTFIKAGSLALRVGTIG